MDENRTNQNKFRLLPPLIPLTRSPPPLCPIPKLDRTITFYESAQVSTLQNQQILDSSRHSKDLSSVGTQKNYIVPLWRPLSTISTLRRNQRNKESENRKSELIYMVKKQLEQLNTTLAVLEKHTNNSKGESLLGHPMPPNEQLDFKGEKKNILVDFKFQIHIIRMPGKH